MRRSRVLTNIFLILFCIAFLTSCNKKIQYSIQQDSIKNEEQEDIYITSKVISPKTDQATITYNGNPINIEYEFNSSIKCDMGLMIFANGVLETMTLDNDKSQKTMHVVTLEKDKPSRFKFSFKPQSGKKGDELVIVFANVFQPKVIDFKDKVVIFGNNQKISQPMPWKLIMKSDAKKDIYDNSISYKTDIPLSNDKIKEFVSKDAEGNTTNQLDDNVVIDIKSNNKVVEQSFELCDAKNLNVDIYGNADGEYTLYAFGDFKPLKINGHDLVEIKVEKDKITNVPLELSKEDVKKYKNFCVIVAPKEKDNFLYKSYSLYIKNN